MQTPAALAPDEPLPQVFLLSYNGGEILITQRFDWLDFERLLVLHLQELLDFLCFA